MLANEEFRTVAKINSPYRSVSRIKNVCGSLACFPGPRTAAGGFGGPNVAKARRWKRRRVFCREAPAPEAKPKLERRKMKTFTLLENTKFDYFVPIGELFKIERRPGKLYAAVELPDEWRGAFSWCPGCAFRMKRELDGVTFACECLTFGGLERRGSCRAKYRADGKDVVFVEIDDLIATNN